MNKDEELMFRLFGADAALPESTEKAIKAACAGLKDRRKRTFDFSAIRQYVSRRAAVIAAAALACAVFAGTALAAGAHYGVFQTIFGTGTKTNENEREYTDFLGDVHEYPLFERFDVDEEAAEKALGKYIVSLDRTVEAGGCTLRFGDFVMDENGIGYVSYTLEAPDGIDGVTERCGRNEIGFRHEGGLSEPFIEAAGAGFVDSRFIINEGMSTDTHACIVQLFAVPSPIELGAKLTLTAGGKQIALPTVSLVPARSFTLADGHTAEVSPLGMVLEHIGHSADPCIINELEIVSGDEVYTVISGSENIENKFFSLLWGVSTSPDNMRYEEYNMVSYVFNRLVIPENITEVKLSVEPFKPHEITWTPGHAEGLATESENPFHFARDGLEVYVFTDETVSGCTDAELKEYCAHQAGFATYDELLADGRFDERLAGRDFMLGTTASLGDGMTTADEALDIYISLVEEHFPDQLSKLDYVVLKLSENEVLDESGCRYQWCVVSTNIDAFFDMCINAETGAITAPQIVGVNGYVDEDKHEFRYYG